MYPSGLVYLIKWSHSNGCRFRNPTPSLSRHPEAAVCKVAWTLVPTYLSLLAATVVGVCFSEIQTVMKNVVVVHVYWDYQFLSVTPPHIYHNNGKNRHKKRKCLANLLLDLTDIGTLQCCRLTLPFRLLKYIWMKAIPSLRFSIHNKPFLSVSSSVSFLWRIDRIIMIFGEGLSNQGSWACSSNNQKAVCDGVVGITCAWKGPLLTMWWLWSHFQL